MSGFGGREEVIKTPSSRIYETTTRYTTLQIRSHGTVPFEWVDFTPWKLLQTSQSLHWWHLWKLLANEKSEVRRPKGNTESSIPHRFKGEITLPFHMKQILAILPYFNTFSIVKRFLILKIRGLLLHPLSPSNMLIGENWQTSEEQMKQGRGFMETGKQASGNRHLGQKIHTTPGAPFYHHPKFFSSFTILAFKIITEKHSVMMFCLLLPVAVTCSPVDRTVRGYMVRGVYQRSTVSVLILLLAGIKRGSKFGNCLDQCGCNIPAHIF